MAVGTFLFARILSEGEDSRFKNIRSSPPKFAGAFFAQATWVSLVLMPVLCVNSLPAAATAATSGLGAFDALGMAIYLGGFGFEALADAQKSQWTKERAGKKHSEQFLTRGLWSKSRHPNYFGETTLWTGIATVAAGVLTSPQGLAGMGFSGGLVGKIAALGLAGVSPAFTAFLLLKVSGVPMSEAKYDRRFKGNKKYQEWKRNTPMFFPKLW
jgi:steroid 5-alpha reductase family enzyme